MTHRIRVPFVILTLLFFQSSRAQAYETATTHPGLAAESALISNLHSYLIRSGFPHGLFTRLTSHTPNPDLTRKLHTIPSDTGARPRSDGTHFTQWALGWLMAGSILEGTPSARDTRHFLDPVTGGGLSSTHLSTHPFTAAAAILEGDVRLRSVFGASPSALEFLDAQENRYGIRAVHRARRALSEAQDVREKQTIAVNLLLALGSVLHVLHDTASPTHVHNDYSAHLQSISDQALDKADPYERFVALAYRRTGLPHRPSKEMRFSPIMRRSWESFFVDDDGRGLANITKRYASPAAIPPVTHAHQFPYGVSTTTRS